MAFGYGFYIKDGFPMPRVLEVDPEQESATRKASKKNLRNQMKEENVIDSKCSVCRKKNKGIKKCNGCFSTGTAVRSVKGRIGPNTETNAWRLNLSTELPNTSNCLSSPSNSPEHRLQHPTLERPTIISSKNILLSGLNCWRTRFSISTIKTVLFKDCYPRRTMKASTVT